MRNYFFTLKTEEEQNVLFDSLFEVFKGHPGFAAKQIIFCKVTEDKPKVYLSIDDGVAGSFGFVSMNAMGEPLKLQFMALGDGCGDFDIVLPKDCMIGSTYEVEKQKEEKK